MIWQPFNSVHPPSMDATLRKFIYEFDFKWSSHVGGDSMTWFWNLIVVLLVLATKCTNWLTPFAKSCKEGISLRLLKRSSILVYWWRLVNALGNSFVILLCLAKRVGLSSSEPSARFLSRSQGESDAFYISIFFYPRPAQGVSEICGIQWVSRPHHLDATIEEEGESDCFKLIHFNKDDVKRILQFW